MASVTRQFVYYPNNTIDPVQNNANEDALYNTINSLDNANVAPAAGIVESKLALDPVNGHDHDGVNSKAIPKGFAFTVTGSLTVGTSASPLFVVMSTQKISKVYIKSKVAPTGASIVVDINKNGTSIWNTNQANRIKILAGATYGTQVSFDTTSLVEGDIISLDIDSVGSGNPGEDLTVQIKA